MSKINNALNITNISGIEELNDDAAAKCSGGYLLRFFSEPDGKGDVLHEYNVQGDSRKLPDADLFYRDGFGSVGVRGESGATYEFRTNTDFNIAFDDSLTTLEEKYPNVMQLSSKGWSPSDEVIFNNDNNIFANYGSVVERTS